MDRFNLPCTEEQTRKALELGAPIEFARIKDVPNTFEHKDILYKFPTAEQMINWLEEQEGISEVDIFHDFGWRFSIWNFALLHDSNKVYDSRKEATIAAIDAALEYLMTIKLNKI